jgi:Ca-activated chloride channel homolog
MNRLRLLVAGILVGLLACVALSPGQDPQVPKKAKKGLGQAVQATTPQQQPAPQAARAPEAFKSAEGKTGWRVVIPGNRALATPAIAQGKVFLGGGFGSHEFYALNAETGKTEWVYRTGDDGPTAAVVEGNYLAFNTESCELELLTLDGQRLWKKWLGDPLMSMPAMHQGKVYMAYPDTKGGGGHALVCFDVPSGKELWKHKIAGDIITAPVIEGDNLDLATLDGTLYCFKHGDGSLNWSDKKNATSSPAVWQGKCYFSKRDSQTVQDPNGKRVEQQQESIAGRGVAVGGVVKALPATTRPADYLDLAKRSADSPQEKANKSYDAGVGFSAAPAAANLRLAGNLGQATVAGVWAFQGSRPFVYKDRLYSSMGDVIKCVDPESEKVLWKHTVRDAKDARPLVDAAVTPPVLVNRKVFVGTHDGKLLCLSAEDGKELWRATLGEPITFQPVVAHGRVYVPTTRGNLYCIETGDADDHGWLMWGANAAHNGRVE